VPGPPPVLVPLPPPVVTPELVLPVEPRRRRWKSCCLPR